MKVRLTLGTILLTIFAAYFAAQSKIIHQPDLTKLHLGMTTQRLKYQFGPPDAQDRNTLTYIFDDSSVLTITLRDEVVASAKIKFHQPLKIEDPKLKEMSLVQMDAGNLIENNPSWFFAGKPEEGLIYKITSEATIESLTWVPPFTYAKENPRHLQVLIRDFKNQHSANL